MTNVIYFSTGKEDEVYDLPRTGVDATPSRCIIGRPYWGPPRNSRAI
jgi:hypothetical protein